MYTSKHGKVISRKEQKIQKEQDEFTVVSIIPHFLYFVASSNYYNNPTKIDFALYNKKFVDEIFCVSWTGLIRNYGHLVTLQFLLLLFIVLEFSWQ